MDLADKEQQMHAYRLKWEQLEREVEAGKRQMAELEERHEEERVANLLHSRTKRRVSPLTRCLLPLSFELTTISRSACHRRLG